MFFFLYFLLKIHPRLENGDLVIVDYICQYLCMHICMHACSVVSDSMRPPWTGAHQAPLSTGFPRQEYWSGLPFCPPGDLPDPGIKPMSLALAGGFFATEPPQKPMYTYYLFINNYPFTIFYFLMLSF